MAARVAAGTGRTRAKPLAGRIFGLFTPYLNRYVARIAGERYVPMWSLLRHRGRTSGRPYATPVTALRVRGGFAVALAFGEKANWYRNVVAGGPATLRSRGREYAVERSFALEVSSPQLAFAGWKRRIFGGLGVRSFLFLECEDPPRLGA